MTIRSQVVKALMRAEARDGTVAYHGAVGGGRYELSAGGAGPFVLDGHGAISVVDGLDLLTEALENGLIAGYAFSGDTPISPGEVHQVLFTVRLDNGWRSPAHPLGAITWWLNGWRAAAAGSAGAADRDDTGDELAALLFDPPLDLQVRLRLRALITARGRTFLSLAQQVGRTQNTISGYLELQGGTGIPMPAAETLARALDARLRLDPVSVLLHPAGEPAPGEPQAWSDLRQLFALRQDGHLSYHGAPGAQQALLAGSVDVRVAGRDLTVPMTVLGDWLAGFSALLASRARRK